MGVFAWGMGVTSGFDNFAELSHRYNAWGHDPESTQRREKRYVGLKAACRFFMTGFVNSFSRGLPLLGHRESKVKLAPQC